MNDEMLTELENAYAIGRAQGLREAADIASCAFIELARDAAVVAEITAAAERAERGGGG